MTAATFEAAYQPRSRTRLQATAFHGAALLAAVAMSAWLSEASPTALAAGAPRVGEYFAKLVPALRWGVLLGGTQAEGSLAHSFYRLGSWAWLLFEASQMALVATLAGAAIAFGLRFTASVNLRRSQWSHTLARRGLGLMRTVPDIVYALIFVWASGVGPPAGILAITLHMAGALGHPAAGSAGPAELRPVALREPLLRFESNVRSASILGVVGAGGIGLQVAERIKVRYWDQVAFIIILIFLTVAVIDCLSARVRQRLING